MTAPAPRSLSAFCPWAADEGVRIYLRPMGLLPADATVEAAVLPLAGGRFAFALVEVTVRTGWRIDRAVAPLSDVMAWARARGAGVVDALDRRLAALTRPRGAFAGVGLDRPRLMGIVNVTPDSFSDGGDFFDTGRAIAHGQALLDAGAEILDVGGESTRPGSTPVSPPEEAARVLPVIRHFVGKGAVVSVDTRHSSVMLSALGAGARIVNDISGLTGDPASLTIVAGAGAPVVLMHMQGEPGTMQQNPTYEDAALDVFDWLEGRVEACVAAGLPLDKIAVDPGIGFGKTLEHNVQILRHASLYHALGCAVLIGVSRKRFVAGLSGETAPKERVPGSIAAGLETASQGAQILRVHDVAETAQARAVWEAFHPAA
ncbi:dihydropteroate synthase [Azospirillum sp.]|uniref:dihydropteroate synthase n=1 Tax=Azospirillum sp. TaxID=34012 RepID=UPI002D228933|nr:dihydropteroate synthase [Azospirillum sp.]HYD65805.1 dihydropteroate synthase [Azospirillum sp.]